MSTGQFGYGFVPGCCVDPACGYQILSLYFDVSQVSRQIYIEMCVRDNKTTWTRSGYGVQNLVERKKLVSRTGCGGVAETSSSYFEENRHNMYTQQVESGSQGGVHPVCEDIVIILLCFTNITASIHPNNVVFENVHFFCPFVLSSSRSWKLFKTVFTNGC